MNKCNQCNNTEDNIKLFPITNEGGGFLCASCVQELDNLECGSIEKEIEYRKMLDNEIKKARLRLRI